MDFFTNNCLIQFMDYVRDGKIQGQCAFKKTKERPCISPSLTQSMPEDKADQCLEYFGCITFTFLRKFQYGFTTFRLTYSNVVCVASISQAKQTVSSAVHLITDQIKYQQFSLDPTLYYVHKRNKVAKSPLPIAYLLLGLLSYLHNCY